MQLNCIFGEPRGGLLDDGGYIQAVITVKIHEVIPNFGMIARRGNCGIASDIETFSSARAMRTTACDGRGNEQGGAQCQDQEQARCACSAPSALESELCISFHQNCSVPWIRTAPISGRRCCALSAQCAAHTTQRTKFIAPIRIVKYMLSLIVIVQSR